MHTADKTFVR